MSTLVNNFKTDIIRFAHQFATSLGGIPSSIMFLTMNLEGDLEATFSDVPEPLMTDTGKEVLSKKVIPAMFERLADEGKYVVAFAFMSEAWLRIQRSETPDEPLREDWKSLEKQEVVMINLETEDSSEMLVYNMNRVGKTKDANGKEIDIIELVENAESKDITEDKGKSTGRFENMFRHFKKPA